MRWLLRDCAQMRNSVAIPTGEQRFPSAVDLWITYVRGYLAGRIAPAGDASRALLVRHEDLLRSPDLVVDQLTRLGLPRNTVRFAPLDTLATKFGCQPRQEILRLEAADLAVARDVACLACVGIRHACAARYCKSSTRTMVRRWHASGVC